MSNAVKRPHAQMLTVANALVKLLAPACHRIEIAGSLRRGVPMVGDIELVAVPILHTNLIGEPMADSSHVDDLLAAKPVVLHKNGPKYKQFSFDWQLGVTITVDLFLQPDPATWGWNFMVRTGSADFSKRMVTPRAYGGLKPDWATIKDARVWRNGAALDTSEEPMVFDLWGMDFVPPSERS